VKAFAATIGVLALVACTPIAAIAPEAPDAHGCHPDTEHYCVVSDGCCMLSWTCGGDIGCPVGQCCDTGEGSSGFDDRVRTRPMRRP